MQFMSRSDQAYPTEEKPMARIQMIVMRHLYLLLGYSPIDKLFHISPPRLRYDFCISPNKQWLIGKDKWLIACFYFRSSSVFNAFLSNLPQMLDLNHLMGASILEAVLHTLLYAPSPSNIASANSESSHNTIYSYSLWRLEPHVRRNWLMAVEVIMYKVNDTFNQFQINIFNAIFSQNFSNIFGNKQFSFFFQYEYTQPMFSQKIHHMVRIILNSLEAQFHKCKRIPATVVMEMPARSRGFVFDFYWFILLCPF